MNNNNLQIHKNKLEDLLKNNLHKLSIDEVPELMTSINISKELIAAFVQQQMGGSTLAMISKDELENDYINDLGMKRAKVKVLWANILRYQHNNFY